MTVPEEWLPTTEPGLSADFHPQLFISHFQNTLPCIDLQGFYLRNSYAEPTVSHCPV